MNALTDTLAAAKAFGLLERLVVASERSASALERLVVASERSASALERIDAALVKPGDVELQVRVPAPSKRKG